MEANLTQFEGKQYLKLETYRKTGAGVRTPVWFVNEENHFYVVTVADTGKVKRIRNRKQVRIVPCEYNGTSTGTWVDARAQILDDEQDENRINDLFNRKYGIQKALYALFNQITGKKRTFIRITVEQA